MKRFYTLLAALLIMLTCSTSVSAGTIIGNEDNTSGWWSAFSDGYTIESGKAYHFVFKNHSDMQDTWHNWVLVAANNATRNAETQGYFEYFALRNDNWFWGPNIAAGNDPNVSISNNFNWEGTSFNTDMNGATVDMIVKYEKGKAISMDATISTLAQKTYNYNFKFFKTDDLTADDITVFFTVENAHIEILTAEEYVEEDPSPYEVIGNKDFTTGYLGDRTIPVALAPGQTYQYTFINHNNINNPTLGNHQNWIFVASQGGADKVVLRADNWEVIAWSNAGCNSGYNWETFSSDYNGAEVTLTVTYTEDNIIKTRAQIKKADGTPIPDYTYNSAAGNITGLSGDIYVALSLENAWLEILDEKFVEVEKPEEVEGAVGDTDFSTPYLGASSEPQTLSAGTAYMYNFINHNDLSKGNPNNWVITVSQNNALIAVVRADNWENVMGTNAGFDSAINWDTFMSDLHDANVTITVNYSNENILTITALTKKASAAAKGMMATSEEDDYLPAYTWSSEKAGMTISGDIVVALSVDNSWVEILDEHECEPTAIRNIAENGNAAATKTVRNGKLVIETANGTYNAVGAMLK